MLRLVGWITALWGHLVWWWPNFPQAKQEPKDDRSRPLLEVRDRVSGWKRTGGRKTWFDGRRFLFLFSWCSFSAPFQNDRCTFSSEFDASSSASHLLTISHPNSNLSANLISLIWCWSRLKHLSSKLPLLFPPDQRQERQARPQTSQGL